MVNRKRVKNIVFYIILTISFYLLLYFVLWEAFLKDYVIYKIEGKQEKDIIESICINGTKLPYDKNTNTFYYSVNKDLIKNDIKLNIEVVSNSNLKNIIDGKEFANNLEINKKIDYNSVIEIYSSTNYFYNKYYIKFTNFPIVSLSNNVNDIKEKYLYRQY